MEVYDAIRHRRAVRDYLPDPVSRPVLEQIVAAAGWAPSALNAQAWNFTVVTDPLLMQRISREAKRFNLESETSLPRARHFRDLMDDPEFNIFYDAPALLVVSTPENRWATADCALAAANAMLMAVELGVGSCWIGFAEGWLNDPQGLAALGLPPGQRVVAPITLGYARTPPPPVGRKPVAVNWITQMPAGGTDQPDQEASCPASLHRDIWNCWEPFMPFPRSAPGPHS